MSGPHSDNWRSSSDWRASGPASSASGAGWRQDRDRDRDRNTRPSSNPQQQQRPRQPNAGRQDDPNQAGDSIAEGRRIYLGNLLYRVKPQEIEGMLDGNGFEGRFEAIHISVDAVTGRNPGYCFIDFRAPEDAALALESLGGVTIQDRPVKIGPCRPKGAEKRWKSDDYKPTFQRWGDWAGSDRRGLDRDEDASPAGAEQGPYGALDHFDDVRRAGTPPRVYVGGLGKMVNQMEHDKEVRGYLESFKIVAISKRITPHADTRWKPGNHHYCFVDFESLEEAEAAIKAVNGKPVVGGELRLQMAKALPQKLR